MTWELKNETATAKTHTLTATFDASKPYRGLAVSFGKAEPIRLFSFLLSEPPIEQYVRGNDLVSKYPARNSDLVSYTTYYRLSEDGRGIDFILSAQTSLLDSAPLTQVVSEFADAGLLFKPSESSPLRPVEGEQVFPTSTCPQFFLVRPNEQPDHSIALMIHPTDFHRGNVRLEPLPTVSLSLFPSALEKGVIRRGKLKMHLVDRGNDVGIAEKLFDELEAAAPPLTA